MNCIEKIICAPEIIKRNFANVIFEQCGFKS